MVTAERSLRITRKFVHDQTMCTPLITRAPQKSIFLGEVKKWKDERRQKLHSHCKHRWTKPLLVSFPVIKSNFALFTARAINWTSAERFDVPNIVYISICRKIVVSGSLEQYIVIFKRQHYYYNRYYYKVRYYIMLYYIHTTGGPGCSTICMPYILVVGRFINEKYPDVNKKLNFL